MDSIFNPKDFQSVKRFCLKRVDAFRVFLFGIGCLLTAGILLISTFWSDRVTEFIYADVTELADAEYVMFVRETGSNVYVRLNKSSGRINPFKPEKPLVSFEFQGNLFYFSQRRKQFRIAKTKFKSFLEKNAKQIEKFTAGLDEEVIEGVTRLYGLNQINVKGNSFVVFAVSQLFYPANFFQLSIAFGFFMTDRVMYSLLVLFYITSIITFQTIEYCMKQSKLESMTENNAHIRIIRRQNGQAVERETEMKNLVVGDLVHVDIQSKFPCDLVIVEGSCLVNEAMLTGESVPVAKTSYEGQKGDKFDQKNCLYSGTYSVYNRNKVVKAVVVGTGWNTTKGELLTPIVFFDEHNLRFDKDLFKLLFFLGWANILLIASLLVYEVVRGTYSYEKDIPKVLQFLKSAFPPSLYFVTLASLQLSAARLKKISISVLKTGKIIEGGAVQVVCFDKTGTITESSLKMYGFVCADEGSFQEYEDNLRKVTYNKSFKPFVETISCCHTLIIYDGQVLGDPMDEQMFLTSTSTLMIEESSGQENGLFRVDMPRDFKKAFGMKDDFGLKVLKVIDFTSERKRVSVIMENKELGEIGIYTKGAPETIKTICDPASIPYDFDDILMNYNEQGYRTIALAFKRLREKPKSAVGEEAVETQDLGIDHWLAADDTELEQNVIFLGLLLFENPLKDHTIKTIKTLNDNYFDSVMVTGDNVFTAANVAYACGMVYKHQDLFIGTLNRGTSKIELLEFNANERVENTKNQKFADIDLEGTIRSSTLMNHKRRVLNSEILETIFRACVERDKKIALEFNCFEYLYEAVKHDEHKLMILMKNIAVFARASAAQKEFVVNIYKSLHEKDSKYVAFVGDGSNDCRALQAAHVGLSIGTDESSFAASFISTRLNISPIIDIIIEGKVCLSNAVQNFRFIMASSLILCFAIYVLNLQKLAINQYDYLYTFVFGFPFAFFMSMSESKKKLNSFKQKPTLLTKETLIPFFLQLGLVVTFMIYESYVLTTFPQYKSVDQIVDVYDKKTFSVDKHFFLENKLLFSFMNISMIVNCFNSYRGFPFKKNFFRNYILVGYMFLIFSFVMFNIFAEALLTGKPLVYFVQKGRIPIYDPGSLRRFFLNVAVISAISMLFNIVNDRIVWYKQLKNLRSMHFSRRFWYRHSQINISTSMKDVPKPTKNLTSSRVIDRTTT